MQRIVMLDRDGTINVEKHYLSSPDQVELLPGAAAGILLLRSLGLKTVVLTNQSGIARGYFEPETLDRIHQRLLELLAEQGAGLDAIYVCPHSPDAKCYCRKPSPGLAWQAASEFHADLSRSFLIGDKDCDIELGKRVEATTILVRTGYGARTAEAGITHSDHIVENLSEASLLIQNILGSYDRIFE